jgi:hypothetical protein
MDPKTGVVVREEWQTNGKLDRADGPAEFVRDPATGTTTKETWYSFGSKHRIDGPAETLRNAKTGNTTEETWYRSGYKHRIGAPAHTVWFIDGKQRAETWWYYDILHRLGGPARTTYYREKDRFLAQWYHFSVWEKTPPEAEYQDWQNRGGGFWRSDEPIVDQNPQDGTKGSALIRRWRTSVPTLTKAIARRCRTLFDRSTPHAHSSQGEDTKPSPSPYPFPWLEDDADWEQDKPPARLFNRS